MTEFDTLAKQFPEPARMAVIDVADSMQIGLAWFKTFNIKPSASDLLTFAAMVLAREGSGG